MRFLIAIAVLALVACVPSETTDEAPPAGQWLCVTGVRDGTAAPCVRDPQACAAARGLTGGRACVSRSLAFCVQPSQCYATADDCEQVASRAPGVPGKCAARR